MSHTHPGVAFEGDGDLAMEGDEALASPNANAIASPAASSPASAAGKRERRPKKRDPDEDYETIH